MRIGFALVVAASLSIVGGRAEAQAPGKWALEVGAWKSEAGESLQIRSAPKGVLTLTAAADSVTGTWLGDGTPAGSRTNVHGRAVGGVLKLSGTRTGRVNINGEESTVEIRIWFDVKVSGDVLSGRMKLQNPMGPSATAEVKGKRSS